VVTNVAYELQASKALIIGFDTPAVIQTSCEPLENLVATRAAQHSPAAHVAAATVCDVHPIPDNVRRGRGGGTAASLDAHALRAVKQFVWLEVGSGRERCLVPPTSGYPLQGATQTQAVGWPIAQICFNHKNVKYAV
jgi:hypothetical protein